MIRRFCVLCVAISTTVGIARAELFFSEYVEGSSFNKALEIYNNSTLSADLTNAFVDIYFNGSSTPGTSINLSGTIAPGGVFVLADNDASFAGASFVNQTSTSNFFNGDDAVALTVGGSIVDVIGQIGVDPGSAWTGGGLSTQNRTLIRNSGVSMGDANGADAFDPSVEFNGLAQDTTTNLGIHTFTGTVPPPPPPPPPPPVPPSGPASTTLLLEDFEDGTVAYTPSVAEFSDGSGDFFTRTDGTNIASSYDIDGVDGSSYFAAMDTNGDGGPTTLSLTFDDINISGFKDLVFSGLFAEDDDGDSNQDWDADSSVIISVDIDNSGTFTEILAFEATGGTNTEPAQDTDFDGIGDGTVLTDILTAFNAEIIGTGDLLDIQIEINNLESGDEDIAFDNIQVSGNPVPEPAAIAIWTLLGLCLTGFGYYRVKRKVDLD